MTGATARRYSAVSGTLLQVMHAPQGLDIGVSGVAIQDPTEGVAAVDGDILLGVGAASDEQVLALLDAAERQGATAVVVKHTVTAAPVAAPELPSIILSVRQRSRISHSG